MWSWSKDELQRLGRFLAEHGLCGPGITAKAIGDGHSNLTFLVSDGDSQVVVRRPPPPPLPPGAGVDSVLTTPSTKSMTKTGTSSSSPAFAVARTRGVGTSVPPSAVKSRASRSTSWAPGGSGGGGGRRTTTCECPSDTRNVRLECPSPMARAVTAGPHSPRSARKRPSCSSSPSDHDHITCPASTGSPSSFPANVSRTVRRPVRRR